MSFHEVFYDKILEEGNEDTNSYLVPHTSSRKVSEILDLLNEFKIQYLENGQVPKVDLNSFELDLFNTFTSFIPKDYFPRKFKNHTDDRGAFVEIMRAGSQDNHLIQQQFQELQEEIIITLEK